MRWIFWFLFVCNLFVLAWRLLPQPAPSSGLLRNQAVPIAEVPQIRLLSELPDSLRQRNRQKPADPLPERSLCWMVGEFRDAAEAQRFIDRLAALDAKAFLHPVDLSSGEGYWVFLDPFINRDAARRRLVELHARGIDSYIIPRGELENGISLGLFTRLDLAQARLEEMSRIGLSAKMQPIERSYRELWVMLGEDEQHKLADSFWSELMQQNVSLQQRQNFCSDVASAKNFH